MPITKLTICYIELVNKKNMRYAAKVDANQSKIVKALRDKGATVLITSQLKNAFDILVGYNGQLHIVEIKDSEQPPSKRKLTKGELKCAQEFNKVGVAYNVITSVEEALEMIEDLEPVTELLNALELIASNSNDSVIIKTAHKAINKALNL